MSTGLDRVGPHSDIEDWAHYAPENLSPILAGALDCFMQKGYHGTTTRELAAAAGLSVPGVYHHYESKHAILVELMSHAMDELYSRSLLALTAANSPEEKLDLHVTCLVLFHAHRQALAFIAASEIRALEPDARAAHLASRDRQQDLLEAIIHEGVAKGLYTVDDLRTTTRAIITMCTGVSQWYRRGGLLTPEKVAEMYVRLIRRSVGVRE
ncbi:TetR/AcrR family transcriptional regulator [Leifsonia bigeumensis]|uniref:TetR/AcrR family transcriptional regulator n=1 Tax=Leifsonella bigeumensis TaxID=433643 RepID=A0ABP7F9B6_9MICO